MFTYGTLGNNKEQLENFIPIIEKNSNEKIKKRYDVCIK